MKELWVPLSGAIAQQRQVETIANNVANANTNGFKKDQIAFKEYLTALEKGHDDIDLPNKEWRPEDFYRSHGAENSFVKVDGTYVDHQQGRLAPTGNPFDMAINGPGFFEVLTPNGVRYTRNGSFSMTREGTVVNSQGFPLLSRVPAELLANKDAPVPGPEERKITVLGNKVSVNLQGELYVDGQKMADLALAEFKDVHALKKEGNSMFTNPDEANLVAGELKSAVNQGFVEESNVNALEEMSNLIKANRQFESIQRVIKTYDNIAGKAVNEINRF